MWRKHWRMILIGLGIPAVLMLSNCAAPAPAPFPGGPAADYAGLVDGLRAAGATVESAGSVNQPFFSVEGKAITVNGENVQVFEYAEQAKAEAEAGAISPDGSSIGTSIVSWIGPPHFFQAGRMIVLYVGDSQEVIGLLTDAVGPQIAGR